MSDEWDFYPLLVDDQPASIYLDMGIAGSAPLPGYDQGGYLRVRMLRPQENGLSSQEEFDDLIALEDALIGAITADSPTVYVGRNTSGGNRDFFFYMKDAKRFEDAVNAATARFPNYTFESGIRSDPEWKAYFEFLYPSPLSRHRMADRALLRTLSDRGDRPDVERPIDHVAIFDDAARCRAFAAFVIDQGFTITDSSPSEDQRGRTVLSFTREDRPAQIDKVTVLLVKAALDHGGEYDGWGCEVVA